jgi:hypothetical protein
VVAKVAPVASGKVVTSADGRRLISMAEVEQHDQDDDVWIVVAGKVCMLLPGVCVLGFGERYTASSLWSRVQTVHSILSP